MTTRHSQRPSRALPRGGFTTIELMVAIAIIVVLLGIVVFGYRSVTTGTQEKQTRTILERLRNMQGTITNNKIAAAKFFQAQVPTIYTGYVGNVGASTALTAVDETTAQPRSQWWEAVPASADDSLYRSALVLKSLMSSPEAKGIFDELPTNRKKLFHFDRVTGRPVDASSPPTTESLVLPLDAWGNPMRYVFDSWQVASSATSARVRTIRVQATPNDVFRETGGLTDLYSDSAHGYWELPTTPAPPNGGTQQPAVKSVPYAYVRPTTATQSLGDAYRAPDRQPFWFSAGPDGLPQTHDDNVYSFEN